MSTEGPSVFHPFSGVYFVRMMPSGPIKIGRSNDIARRVHALQNGSPHGLKVCGWIPIGSQWTEERVHTKFAHLRMRGEWFRPGSELFAFIASESNEWKNRAAPEDDEFGNLAWLRQNDYLISDGGAI